MTESAAEPQDSTFLFADLAGYTALTEAMGDEKAADVAADFFVQIRALLDEYRAEEVKTIGDAVLVRVPQAQEGIHLAARIVGDFGARHRVLGVRVGMHTGSAVHRDGDWFGATVNIASRVADVARAGEVLITSATRDAASAAVLPGQLRPRGRRTLKNVREPVELLALVPEADEHHRALPVDPVCRMSVNPAQAGAHQVHRGVEYHFCSEACADAFRTEPQRYIGRQSSRALMLVSDQRRDRAARRLARGYAKGRFDADELDERTERVWSARTRADLEAVTADLPHRRRTMSPWLWPFWPAVCLIHRTRRTLRKRRGNHAS